MVVVDRGIDEVRVQRGAQITGQGVRNDPVETFDPGKWITYVGAERSLERVIDRTAGGEQHLVYAQIGVLSGKRRCRARTAAAQVCAGGEPIAGIICNCRPARYGAVCSHRGSGSTATKGSIGSGNCRVCYSLIEEPHIANMVHVNRQQAVRSYVSDIVGVPHNAFAELVFKA